MNEIFNFFEEKMLVPKLIKCTACHKEISHSAVSCPNCGEENRYIHPFLADFVKSIPNIKPAIQSSNCRGNVFEAVVVEINNLAIYSFPALAIGYLFNKIATEMDKRFIRNSLYFHIISLVFLGISIYGLAIVPIMRKKFYLTSTKSFRVEVTDNGIKWEGDEDVSLEQWKTEFEKASKKYFKN
jgi:hypothetical protein